MKNRRLLLAAAALLLGTVSAWGAELRSAPASSRGLEMRWKWALQQAAASASPCYVGYSIRRLMERGSRIYCGRHTDEASASGVLLADFLAGKKTVPEPALTVAEAARAALAQTRRQAAPLRESRELAIVFELPTPLSSSASCRDLWISTLDDRVRLKDIPFYWLGSAGNDESLAFLKNRYEVPGEPAERNELLAAIALHDEIPVSLAFLAGILNGEGADDLRGQAAFWIGEKNDLRAVDVLDRAAAADRSGEVREKAVFGLSRLELPSATDRLIGLARGDKRLETRKQAIFWLSQQAAARIPGELAAIAGSDPQSEIRQQAVFALSQLPADRGVPELVRLARRHGDMAVRKKAIFWLGQSDSPAALQAIVDILGVKR